VTFDLAVEGMVERVPEGWLVEPFRRHAKLVDDTNRRKTKALLSLSSSGIIAPRTEDGGLGRQAPAEGTIERYWIVSPGDLVVNPMWLIGGGIGVSTTTGAVSPDYRVYRLAAGIYPRYMHYLLRSQPYRDQYRLYTRADTTFDRRVSKVNFHAMPIIVPPVEEQRRIADFLDAETAHIDQLIQSFGDLKRLLRQRRMSAVYSLVTKVGSASSKPSGLPWVHDVPSHWRVARVGFFAKMGSGHTPSRSRLEWWRNPKHGWITTGEVAQVRDDRREVINKTREKISDLGLANSSAVLHPKGTVVLCRTASAGYSAIMGEEMATSQDFVTWTCGKQLDPFYLLWCLRAMRPDLLGRLATGSTHKTIYVPDLQMLKIPVPPIEEQREIVRSVRASNDTVDALADAVDAQVALLEERRRAVVTAAVTGELDVTTARRVS
jgi:type I restriction enzyme S subunit